MSGGLMPSPPLPPLPPELPIPTPLPPEPPLPPFPPMPLPPSPPLPLGAGLRCPRVAVAHDRARIRVLGDAIPNEDPQNAPRLPTSYGRRCLDGGSGKAQGRGRRHPAIVRCTRSRAARRLRGSSLRASCTSPLRLLQRYGSACRLNRRTRSHPRTPLGSLRAPNRCPAPPLTDRFRPPAQCRSLFRTSEHRRPSINRCGALRSKEVR